MTRTGWTLAAAACIMGTFTGTARAQDTLRTTQSGIYTEAQAKRGAETYAGVCQSCHTPSEHTGAQFEQSWNRHPLSDLFAYLCEKMPKDNPGTLDPADVADVMAYLLKINAMPAGAAELPPDTLVLKKILIDTRPTRPPQ